jgi:hypothetical protein
MPDSLGTPSDWPANGSAKPSETAFEDRTQVLEDCTARYQPRGQRPRIVSGGAKIQLGARRIIICVLVVSSMAISPLVRLQAQASENHDHRAISILDYGAVPDGSFDSTIAIESAISAAKLRGRSVLVPPGTFQHKSFSLNGVSMLGEGSTSILFAPDPKNSNIYLRGARPSLRNLTVRVQSSERDSHNFAIYVDGAVNFLIEFIAVDGGNAGGIFNFGGHNGRIIYNLVQNTLADAIHNTHGAHDIIVAYNTVRHAGDDMIAVVSYSDQTISHNILITHNVLTDSDGGRGISVVGGQDVTIQGNTVARTACCAGIYLASEAFWDTQEVRNILVCDNLLAENSGPTEHGAIMIYSNHGSVRSIRVEHNTIVHARHAAIRLSGNVGDVSFVNNSIANPAEEGISGTGTNVSCADNTLDGLPIATATCGPAQSTVTVTGSTLNYVPNPDFCGAVKE